jgi:hypothetical protein
MLFRPRKAAAQSSEGDLFMTQGSRLTSSTCLLAIGVLLASSACAQTTQSRKHAAAPPVSGPLTSVVGVVKDASTGLLIQQAIASYGDQTTNSNGNGEFVLKLPAGAPVTVTVQNPAFQPLQQTVTAQSGGRYNFALTSLPSVTIKMKTNETHIVDIGTAKFETFLQFGGGVASDTGNFCKEDGSEFKPAKTDISRIIGPAVPVSGTSCCQGASVMSANLEMKSGAKLLVYFKDSCTGNSVAFVGREKSTGTYLSFLFSDIAEVDFP